MIFTCKEHGEVESEPDMNGRAYCPLCVTLKKAQGFRTKPKDYWICPGCGHSLAL